MNELRPSEQEAFLNEALKLPLNQFIPLLFAIETGLRLNELAEVRIFEVRDKDSFWVRTLKQKKETSREIPISKKLKAYLNEYFKFYDKINIPIKNKGQFLFITQERRNPMSPRYIQHICTETLRKIGIERGGPHTLRHTFARNLIRKGVRLEIIQTLLGHASLSSTGIYIKPDKEEIFSAIA